MTSIVISPLTSPLNVGPIDSLSSFTLSIHRSLGLPLFLFPLNLAVIISQINYCVINLQPKLQTVAYRNLGIIPFKVIVIFLLPQSQVHSTVTKSLSKFKTPSQ